jgi:hypothetical protein
MIFFCFSLRLFCYNGVMQERRPGRTLTFSLKERKERKTSRSGKGPRLTSMHVKDVEMIKLALMPL